MSESNPNLVKKMRIICRLYDINNEISHYISEDLLAKKEAIERIKVYVDEIQNILDEE